MNISNKRILITGGGSGIGFEIARQLSAKGNQVLITGRTETKLQQAAAKLKGVHYFAADINDGSSVSKLKTFLIQKFNGLDILINNAGHAAVYRLTDGAGAAGKAAEEIKTNYISVIRVTDELMPLLQKSPEAAIVNVSSIAALVPNSVIPTYSASKAALHSYTQSLRYALSKTTGIKVFELMPPLVDTDFSVEIGGSNGIPPAEVADSLIEALEKDVYEIHTGKTAYIYETSRSSPAEAFKLMNQDRGN
jgi:uncharacterized oxidoreductase